MSAPDLCVKSNNTSGIYAIYSECNGRRYVGSSIDISGRWVKHVLDLRKGTHHSPHLQAAWDKHGEEAFEFIVLEECAVEILIEREQFHMDQYSDKYNIALVAGAPTRGTTLSQEHREKISASLTGHKHTPETRAKMGAAAQRRDSSKGLNNGVGRIHSSEHRAKISESLMGHEVSEESREKMRQKRIGKKLSPESIAKRTAAQTGLKRSDETRARISEARKAYWERKRAEEAATNNPVINSQPVNKAV